MPSYVSTPRKSTRCGLHLILLLSAGLSQAATASTPSAATEKDSSPPPELPSTESLEQAAEQLPVMGRGTLNVYFENDLFADSDQEYTNGMKISLISPDLERFDQDFIRDPVLRGWFNWLHPKLERFHPKPYKQAQRDNLNDSLKYGGPGLSSRRVVLSLGQNIYTPSDQEAEEVVEDQRPYAGWLYLGVAYHARYQDQLKTVGINMGMVGPASLAEHTQNLIHDMRDIDTFNGWDNQLDNEPGVQLIYEKKDKLINQTGPHFGYDLISHYGGSFGNVAIYANAGAEARMGWNIPDDFGTSALRPGGDNSSPDGVDRKGFGLHAFISVDGRLVGRDIFLDGNTFSNSHSVDKEYWVADAATGISLVHGRFKMSFAHVIRTREYRAQEERHEFGSLTLSWDYQL